MTWIFFFLFGFLQAMEFQEAQALCEHALAIHREHSEPGSLEEAADRRLLALVFSAKGDHEKALENLVLASATLQANNLEVGDTLLWVQYWMTPGLLHFISFSQDPGE